MNFNATLIGQTISFAAFVWFCMKFVWPPIMQALEERKAKIADGLAAARAEIDQEVNRVKEELRGKVVSIALAGAGKVLEREVDESAHGELLEKLAAEI